MRILVTGATGFIGSYLCKYLLQQGHEVIAAMRTVDAETSLFLSGAEILQLDVLNNEHLKTPVTAAAVVHTATSNDIVSKDAYAGMRLSALGTKNMLDFAVQNGISKFICFSTFQVYGTELNGEITENTPLACLNDYGLNHLFAEEYVRMYGHNKKMNGVIVRPSNVFGEIMTGYINRWTLVPACFCREAYEKGTITILSSGRQVRNFVSLENVSASVECILNNYPAQTEVYNIAGSQNFDMLTVAQKVKEVFESLYKKEISILVKGNMPAKANDFSVNISRLKSKGFREDTVITLETEIQKIFRLLEKKGEKIF